MTVARTTQRSVCVTTTGAVSTAFLSLVVVRTSESVVIGGVLVSQGGASLGESAGLEGDKGGSEMIEGDSCKGEGA